MASFKLHLGLVRGCPAPAKLAEALTDFGLPESGEFGVLNHTAASDVVHVTLVRRIHQSVQRVETDTRDVVSAEVERVNVYPFAVRPAADVLEVYAGAGTSIKHIEAFLAGALALPVVAEPIEVDIAQAIERLAKSTERFQLRTIRVNDYAHNSYMAGPYSPKFLDSQHGIDFLTEYAQSVTTAGVKFSGPTGRVSVTLKNTASFGYSCNEDDQPTVQSILRKLI